MTRISKIASELTKVATDAVVDQVEWYGPGLVWIVENDQKWEVWHDKDTMAAAFDTEEEAKAWAREKADEMADFYDNDPWGEDDEIVWD